MPASHPFLHWLRTFVPAPLTAGRREIALGTLGAGLGLLAAEWLSRHALGSVNPWFVAPMGASAVLLFAVPASPLAQPWSIMGGNLISALIGVTCQHWLGHGGAVAALAGGVAVATMFALRCLHPPGGAVALTAVLGGPAIHQLGYSFALWPVAVNSAFMLGMALLFNNLSGRRYPHHAAQAHPHRTRDPLPSHRASGFKEDLDSALASFGEVLDIDRDDLEEILVRAQLNAQRRQWGEVLCRDVMSRDVVQVHAHDRLDEAWRRLARHRVQALPVTDQQHRLVGIVSMHDFFLAQTAPIPQRLPRLTTAHSIADIMTTHVVTARPEQALADLVGHFSDRGLHHLPVVDAEQRVVGMITQSDVVAALFRGPSRMPAPPDPASATAASQDPPPRVATPTDTSQPS